MIVGEVSIAHTVIDHHSHCLLIDATVVRYGHWILRSSQRPSKHNAPTLIQDESNIIVSVTVTAVCCSHFVQEPMKLKMNARADGECGSHIMRTRMSVKRPCAHEPFVQFCPISL